jgi:hypothetical protein
MDEARFDRLTKSVAGPTSRRMATAGLLAGLLGLVGARAAGTDVAPQGCKVRRCRKGQLNGNCKNNHDCCSGLKCKNKKCKFKNNHGGAGDYCKNDRDCDRDFFCKKNQCIPNSCQTQL